MNKDRLFLTVLRSLTVLVFGAVFLYYIQISRHWRMAVDTPVMHYVVFLMQHGLHPYTDITDNNMPGTYLTEAAAMAVFGGSDLAWRVYEFFLLGLLGLSASLIARRWDWVAGVFGAGLFTLLHSAEGPQLAVERELIIGVLLMTGCALLFESVDRRLPFLLVFFGLCCGTAAAIKPTFLPLGIVLLLPASLHLRAEGRSLRPYLAAAAGGLLLVVLLLTAFLVHFHALAGFGFILFRVVPAYGGMHSGFWQMVRGLVPRAVLLLTLFALPLAWFRRAHIRDWRVLSLLIVLGFGLLSYFAQGKGYVYHRYIFLMFLLLLTGMVVFAALRRSGWPRWIAVACLGLAFSAVPGHLHSARNVVGETSFELTLERDLQSLGGQKTLSGNVQCFDLVFGCLDALYHQQIVDTTGFTGDMLFFAPRITPPVLFYRRRFWNMAARQPARVLVVSNGAFGEENSYSKLHRWPEFEHYLEQRYVLALQRDFPHELYTYHTGQSCAEVACDSYRLYILREDDALRAKAQELELAPNVALR